MMNNDSKTSSTLLDLLKDSTNHQAWRRFEQRYRELILRYCSRRGLQHCDAEDVRQDVMARLSHALSRGFQYDRERGRFRSYLGRVVANAVHTHRTRSGPELESLDPKIHASSLPQEAAELDDIWQEEWRNHHVRLAFQWTRSQTSERDLRIFESLLAGHSVREVADQESATEAAIYKVKQRVRNLIRQQIQSQLRDEKEL